VLQPDSGPEATGDRLELPGRLMEGEEGDEELSGGSGGLNSQGDGHLSRITPRRSSQSPGELAAALARGLGSEGT
jgi:hypothetical protein